ncbi:DUF2934 domain-containing protein [uncultured Celeribacter sp.]|uniref:DUF2934 domain-containing protein n=1 Tax=uncultured Celeribacter sp. TaxID=1303376 RepID=UPI002AA7B117|nr:DUF2934 domain-containing protein [uncultured Celeribacter sp.]
MTQTTPSDAQISEAAYFMWLEEGMPEGRDEAHWLKAVEVLSLPETAPAKAPRKRAAPKTATKTAAKPATKTAAAKKPAAKKPAAKTSTAAKKPRATKAPPKAE